VFEIGASLREARLRRGLSAEDVQKAIRIRDRYLTALEEEQWELLPGTAYVKGFLRTYAEFLGLDGTLYLDEFNERVARRADPAVLAEAVTPIRRRRRGPGVPLLAAGALLAVVAAVAAWQLGGSSGTPAPTRRTAPPGATTPHTAPRPHHKPAPGPKPVLPTQAVLTAATGRVWLLVRSGSASGRVVFEGTLEQGQTLPVRLSPRVWIRIGAPSALSIRLGGRTIAGLPAAPENVILSGHGLAPAP
jgi:cytoskeleton protein RodZ